MKKAIFYTMDALLASMLLIGAVMLIYYTYSPEDTSIEQQTFISQDVLTVLSELKISELNNSFINSEIASGNITDVNKTVIDQIGEFWAMNQIPEAQNLLQLLVNDSLPKDRGVRTSMGNNTLLLRNTSGKTNSVSSNRMIAGIEQGKPITGSSGTASLKKIRNKKTSSYSYFGGFVGQGNISININLPSDFNSSRMIDALIKLDTPGTFKLYINSIQCGASYIGNNTRISVWNISSCNNSLNSGTNVLSMIYTSTLNISYVSGGFVKITYTTDTLIENLTRGHYRYYFPDINGFINFYDTLSVQGNIQNWTLNTTFFNPYQTFFTFGNETIFLTQGNFTANQSELISRYNQMLPQEPIPLRIAVTNFSNITTVLSGLPADMFLITDVSGSMGDCIPSMYNCSYLYRTASNPTYFPISCVVDNTNKCDGDPDNFCNATSFFKGKTYVNSCVTKIGIAKSADINFVNGIFNNSLLHHIGLLDFSYHANTLTNLTNNASQLISIINLYAADGGTCSCCAINRARDAINSSANNRYIIFLSDGDPTYYCKNLSDYSGSYVWGSDGTGGSSEFADRNWTIAAGKEACNHNITVYTIGFGTGMSAAGIDTMKNTSCNSSLYFNATDTSKLQSIFNNITQQILIAANFSSQTVTVSGNFTNSRLFGSSYIDVDYIPLSENLTQNKISLVKETSQFNGCNASIYIPANIEVQDAYVTSYSGSHWTKQLVVNGITVFNLTKYGSEYLLLGDPFVIQIPSLIIQPGINNTFVLSVGDSPTNSSNCSNNNTLIYTALVDASTEPSDALEKAVGCNWTIESISGSTFNMLIPSSAPGNKTCYYTSMYKTNASFYPYAYRYDLYMDDVYDVTVYNLLKQLDYENSGKIFFDLSENDLEIVLSVTGKLAYMWGPSLMNIEVWQ